MIYSVQDRNGKMTAGGKLVTAYAKSTVVSTAPVGPGKTHQLSALDHAMEAHSLHMVLYYRAEPSLNRVRLKESMSEMLWHFPAATGRLSRGEGGWTVKCNDAGVRVIDARVDSFAVDEWIATATAADQRALVHWEPMGKDPSIWSPFYIQITEFKDKGYAIGLSCAHMHCDPTCAALILKAWSDCHRRAHISHPPFFHPPALIPRDAPNLSSPLLSLKSSLPALFPRPMSAATFRFSASSVRSLLGILRPDFPGAAPFDVLSALFCLAIASAMPSSPAVRLAIVTDFRRQMYAPLPHGFYGNAAHFSGGPPVDLAAGWAPLASSIGRHVAGLEEEEYWSAIEWLADRRERGDGAFQMYGPELTCVKLDHVMVYGVEMEEGVAPAHVSCWVGGAQGDGLVVVLPAAAAGGEDEGRVVEVLLPSEHADRVWRDAEILRLGPTVIFSGKIN